MHVSEARLGAADACGVVRIVSPAAAFRPFPLGLPRGGREARTYAPCRNRARQDPRQGWLLAQNGTRTACRTKTRRRGSRTSARPCRGQTFASLRAGHVTTTHREPGPGSSFASEQHAQSATMHDSLDSGVQSLLTHAFGGTGGLP